MAPFKPTTVDDYIAQAAPEARPTVEAMREVILATLPEAVESIKYNVPFYTFGGDHVGFSVFTNHATFGFGADVLDSVDRERLERKGYRLGKGTLMVRFDQDVPRDEFVRILERKLAMLQR